MINLFERHSFYCPVSIHKKGFQYFIEHVRKCTETNCCVAEKHKTIIVLQFTMRKVEYLLVVGGNYLIRNVIK